MRCMDIEGAWSTLVRGVGDLVGLGSEDLAYVEVVARAQHLPVGELGERRAAVWVRGSGGLDYFMRNLLVGGWMPGRFLEFGVGAVGPQVLLVVGREGFPDLELAFSFWRGRDGYAVDRVDLVAEAVFLRAVQ